MTYAEILSLEESNTHCIYLFREGTFLKAYERSAFLFHRNIKEFKLSRRYIKTVNRYVISLGFPEAALKKWIYAYPLRELNPKLLVCELERTVDEVEYANWTEYVASTARCPEAFTVHTSVIEGQPVYKTAIDVLYDVMGLARNIDKDYRDPLAVRSKRLSYDIAYGVRTLYDVPDRERSIEAVQACCKELLFAMQTLKDLRQISTSAYARISEKTVSVSKQLEALRRTAKA